MAHWTPCKEETFDKIVLLRRLHMLNIPALITSSMTGLENTSTAKLHMKLDNI